MVGLGCERDGSQDGLIRTCALVVPEGSHPSGVWLASAEQSRRQPYSEWMHTMEMHIHSCDEVIAIYQDAHPKCRA